MFKPALFITLCLWVSSAAYAEELIRMGDLEITANELQAWQPDAVQAGAYQGIYHFDNSEAEFDLRIIFANNRYYVQKKSGGWAEDGKAWLYQYENFTEVTFKENEFSAKEARGRFVMYSNQKALLLEMLDSTPQTERLLGIGNANLSNAFDGDFPNASLQHLTPATIQGKSKQTLKIMRNEIFARYGYVFKPGGEMEAYFKMQTWYQSQHQDVSKFLTDLERQNIELIKQFEK